jgi:hypothetical protein
MSLQKHWAIPFFGGDKGDLQVRVDASDVTNNPNFGQPNPALALKPGTTTGQLVTAGGYVDSMGNFHAAQQINSANTSRAFQFEAKFSF